MKTIPLTNSDKQAFVNNADHPRLSKDNWQIDKEGYVTRCQYDAAAYEASGGTRKGITVRMHRVVIGAKSGERVDHKNRNRLDNRRRNLRIATRSENGRNRGVPLWKKGKSSKFKGVHWDRRRDKWSANITKHGRYFYLGWFDEESDAAAAYNRAAKRLFGRFAWFNKIAK